MGGSQTRSAVALINGTARTRPAELLLPTLKPLARALRRQWKCYRKQLRKASHKLSERSVHDLRVEARRLLSLLNLLSPLLSSRRLERAQCGLHCHLDTFDDLRDLQVQLALVPKLQKGLQGVRPFERFLKKREDRCYRRTRKRARQLSPKSLAKPMKACRQDVRDHLNNSSSRRTQDLLFRGLTRSFAAVERAKDRIDPEDPHSIHCTRIAFKKFRYMLESLCGLLSWVDEGLCERMRRYQGLMGDIQDNEVLLRVFRKFQHKAKLKTRPAMLFTRRLLRRRGRLIAAYLSASDQLCEFWPPKPVTHRPARRGSGAADQHFVRGKSAKHPRRHL